MPRFTGKANLPSTRGVTFARDIYAIIAKNFVIIAKFLLSVRLFISQRRHDNYRKRRA